jgi:UDP-N-acetyl-D-glucosamine dehydrogenase
MTATTIKRKRSATMATAFEKKIADRTLKVAIVGMGYVGLPLAEAFIDKGIKVIGFDVDQTKVDALKKGQSYIRHIPSSRVSKMLKSELLQPTTEARRLADADAIVLCVPTPLNIYREPDLSYVESTTRTVARYLKPGQIVILESTTYPGTSEEVMIPILEEISGLKAGKDFAIAYSPEREDPGNKDFSTHSIPKVVGANSDSERQMACALYSVITKVVPVSDLKTAEAVKLTENIFRLVNIALVNELKSVYGGLGIDVWEVINAAKTKPFGFMAFYPGPGLGGHCIPIDPFYLTWKARAAGESTRFIELAGEIITRLPRQVVEALAVALSTRVKKPISGSKILVLGLAYKKNVDDMRESPSLHLMSMLKARGATVAYHDPYIPEVPHTREHPEFAGMESVAFNERTLRSFDAVLIATDHDGVDYAMLARSVPLIVDTRNAMKDVPEGLRSRVVKA